MKLVKNDTVAFETNLARFLLVYRSTQNTTTGESPAELVYSIGQFEPDSA